MPNAKTTWAELRRDSETLLVPYLVWFTVCMNVGRRPPDEVSWDEQSGTWQVSASTAPLYANALKRHSATEFRAGVARAELGLFMSGTIPVQALDPEAAEEALKDAKTFLLSGAFAWRFISL